MEETTLVMEAPDVLAAAEAYVQRDVQSDVPAPRPTQPSAPIALSKPATASPDQGLSELATQRAAAARARTEEALSRLPQQRSIEPGQLLAGRFRVSRVLSRERGLLLDVVHTGFDRRCVMRVISPALSEQKRVERFHREAKTLSHLESEHSARILDVGTLADGSLYLVREYLEGISARAQAQQGLDLADALHVFLQVCEAVAEAHSEGVVLRDLQPAHIFLARRRNGEPLAKITDYGTCKVMRSTQNDGELSCTRLMGLSSSASPELIRQDRTIDERADIWSLGCLLYELVTGKQAFEGEGTVLMLAIAQHEPHLPSQLRQGVPQAIDDVVAGALHKARERRFNSVWELVRGLAPLTDARGRVLLAQIARLSGAVFTDALDDRPSDELPMAMVMSVGDAAQSGPYSTAPVQNASLAPAAFSIPPAPATPQPWELETLRPPSPRRSIFAVAAAIMAVPLAVLAFFAARGDSLDAPVHSVMAASAPIVVVPEAAAAEAVDDDVDDVVEASDEEAAAPETDEPVAVASAPSGDTHRAAPKGYKPAKKSTKKAAAVASDAKESKQAESAAEAVPSTGTLVAMAAGSSCTFTVDGAPRGSGSSIRVQVSPGTHTVGCQPVGGSRRTRSVSVTAGKAAVSVFRF